MQLDKEDFEEIHQNYAKALNELQDFELKTDKTKKEIVEKLREYTLLLVEYDLIPCKLSGVCSYVLNELKNRGIDYSKGHFYDIFEDEEKGNYNKSSLGDNHVHNFINGECECSDIEHNGLIYTQAIIEHEEEDEDDPPATTKTNFLTEEYQDLFKQYSINLKSLATESNSILSKGEDSKTADVIMYALPNVGSLLKEAKGQEAQQMAHKKKLDGRAKISEFMKLKAILLETCEYTIAKVAKLLDITPKHFSNNIRAQANPQALKINPKARNLHHEHLTWFKCINFKCICGKVNIIDINDWWHRQIKNKELELEFNDPIINYGVAE